MVVRDMRASRLRDWHSGHGEPYRRGRFMELKRYGSLRLPSADGKYVASGGVFFGRGFRCRDIGSGGNRRAETGQAPRLPRNKSADGANLRTTSDHRNLTDL